ncbi:MAG: hypothetical protein KIS94_04985 [Chitinophagales bacterium]|nr:hypothetical protein [Chitinophagales bacterium]
MQTKVLSLQQKDGLAVVQFSTIPNNTIDYVSLADAMQKNQVEVTEVDESGTVNEIYVINRSKHFVFLMDGDILSGAKQNRVLNTSVLLAPEAKTILPVSCVEQGRWNYKSNSFRSTDYVAPVEMRKRKSEAVTANLKHTNQHFADQSQVWSNVSEYSSKFSVISASSNLSDVFEQRESSYEKLLHSFCPESEANGVAFFIDKQLKNIDVFNRQDIYKEYFPKMIKGAALDVYGVESKNQLPEAEAFFKTLDLLDKIETIEPEIHKGVGAGQEKRFGSAEVSGFELQLNGHLIHLSAHAGSNELTKARIRIG